MKLLLTLMLTLTIGLASSQDLLPNKDGSLSDKYPMALIIQGDTIVGITVAQMDSISVTLIEYKFLGKKVQAYKSQVQLLTGLNKYKDNIIVLQDSIIGDQQLQITNFKKDSELQEKEYELGIKIIRRRWMGISGGCIVIGAGGAAALIAWLRN